MTLREEGNLPTMLLGKVILETDADADPLRANWRVLRMDIEHVMTAPTPPRKQ
jgi:hypothetical protein